MRAVARAAPPRRRIGGVAGRRPDEHLGLPPTVDDRAAAGIIPRTRGAWRVRRSPRGLRTGARLDKDAATGDDDANAGEHPESIDVDAMESSDDTDSRRDDPLPENLAQAQLAPQAPQPFPERVVRGDADGDRLVPGL